MIPIAKSIADFKSASSKTINGAFPPNSILNLLILVEESEKTFFAVFVDPIIVMSLGILLLDKVAATISGSPQIIFTTPAGKSISFKSLPIK